MKILIGAGQVGYNIASYLSDEGNNVTIVDNDPVLIAKVNDELDVNGIVGYASSPEVLDSASAEDCELMIAVTRSDEVIWSRVRSGTPFSVFLKRSPAFASKTICSPRGQTFLAERTCRLI